MTPRCISRLGRHGHRAFLISSSCSSLARTSRPPICPNCKEELPAEQELLDKLEIEVAGTTFFHGVGCDRCKRRGYQGRAAIIEVLPISETIRRLIISVHPLR
jgi:type II secretory ATPase GspE/PulE/Tfp pilus assembly ATPase PilB-like protein